MEKIRETLIRNKKNLLSCPAFIIYYFVLTNIFGLSYLLIYALVVVLLVFRNSFEIIAAVFFVLTIVSYVFGNSVEANHYMSFVYGFIVLILIRTIIKIARERFDKKESNHKVDK